jgi:GntR family transcriptional regulator, trigonelline degradation regulator
MFVRQDCEPTIVTSLPEQTQLTDLSFRLERVAAPLREQVLDLLRAEITELRLLPGQRLVERELIERIGVSRTTIREVLRELTVEGLVTTIPQKGAIVAIPSARQAAEVYEVRALLEGAAAKEFALKATDVQVRALRDAFVAVERSQNDEDVPQAMLQAKNRFYEVLFDGAGNATIRSILAGLQARVSVLRATTMAAPERPRESVVEIRAIVAAIERRDAEGAGTAASFHVRQAAKTLFKQLEESNQSNQEGS